MPNFYPRPPRGGRPLPWAAEAMSWAISIHALREEGDKRRMTIKEMKTDFYPRPPRGGRRESGSALS